jgi:hypothetical protein
VSLPATPSPLRTPTPIRTPQPPSIAPRSVRQLAPTPGQATPCRLDFADTPAQPIPRVPLVSLPANSYPPPAPPALLPVCKSISYCTRSYAQAPLALFTSGQPYHKQVKYHIPTAKATRPTEEPLVFAGLCETFHMKPAEVDAFAFLCEAVTLEDGPGLLVLSVLDPATGKFLEHRQLCRDPRYKATWDTSYTNKLGRLCQGIGRGCTGEFSCAKAKQKIGSTYATKIEAKKMSRSTICATPKIGDFSPPSPASLSLNRPLQYYYRHITRVCSRFWRRSRRGTSLARATAKPESQICNSPWRKNHRRTLKFTATMAILLLSSAEVPPHDA